MLHFLPDRTFLFALAVSSAAVELALTAYLMIAGSFYHSLQIMFLFDALCTVLFLPTYLLWSTRGALNLLADLIGSVFWIFASAIVWGSAIGFVHNTRARRSCKGRPSDLRCTHYISPGSLAWMEFALCVVTLVLTIIWVKVARRRGKSYYRTATIQHHLRFDV